MILYPILSKQDTKQDTKLKSVILSDIRFNEMLANKKAGPEKPCQKSYIVIKFFNNLVLRSVLAYCERY